VTSYDVQVAITSQEGKVNRVKLSLGLVMPILCLQLVACGPTTASPTAETKPAKVEHLDGAEPTRVTLTDEAARRIDLRVATVGHEMVGGAPRVVIPYSAIVYDTSGKTWTYINPTPLTFVRHAVSVDHIDGDKAILAENLTADTTVVTVGAEELLGTESEFEEE
jgi:hypothetical protein